MIADANIIDFIWIIIAVLIGIVSFIKGLIERLAKARQSDAPPRPISETIREELRRVLGSDEKEPSTPPPPVPPLPEESARGGGDDPLPTPLLTPLPRPRSRSAPVLARPLPTRRRKAGLARLLGGTGRQSLRRAIIAREILEPRFRRLNPKVRRR